MVEHCGGLCIPLPWGLRHILLDVFNLCIFGLLNYGIFGLLTILLTVAFSALFNSMLTVHNSVLWTAFYCGKLNLLDSTVTGCKLALLDSNMTWYVTGYDKPFRQLVDL